MTVPRRLPIARETGVLSALLALPITGAEQYREQLKGLVVSPDSERMAKKGLLYFLDTEKLAPDVPIQRGEPESSDFQTIKVSPPAIDFKDHDR